MYVPVIYCITTSLLNKLRSIRLYVYALAWNPSYTARTIPSCRLFLLDTFSYYMHRESGIDLKLGRFTHRIPIPNSEILVIRQLTPLMYT